MPTIPHPQESYLLEYAELEQVFRAYTDQHQMPPLAARLALKRCESNLPSSLIQYYRLISKYMSPFVTAADGLCPDCCAPVVEWTFDRRKLHLCGECGAILLQPTEKSNTCTQSER